MTYRVCLSSRAQRELVDVALWWGERRSADQALRWLEGFENAIDALAERASNCSLARENEKFDYPLYQLHYGIARKPTHRALFTIRGDTVHVLTIRHLAQRELEPGDI